MCGQETGVVFQDRRDAGRTLAQALLARRAWKAPLVLALPRGGVPVAWEVAQALGAPLDVFVVRKIGHPRHEEFALGAIAAGGLTVMNTRAHGLLGDVSRDELACIVAREQAELARRESAYRAGMPPLDVAGREAIVVDDGLATGATMRVAVDALRELHPLHVTVAVPVGGAETVEALRPLADDVVCVRTPSPFHAVGAWYARFEQTSDAEVMELLRRARRPDAAAR